MGRHWRGSVGLSARRWLYVGLAVLVGAAMLAGCQQQGDGGGGDQEDGGGVDINAISSEWAESTHTQIVTNAAEEAFCVQCHDGGAFALGVMDPAELDREWPVSTDCRACHTGRGAEAIESGEASAPVLSEPLDIGMGALCANCHRSLGKPELTNEERETPHHSPIIDIYSGEGGLRTDDMQVGSSEGHREVDEACVGCHMADIDGYPSHTFSVADVGQVCGGCHDDLESAEGSETPDVDAQGDYDGSGSNGTFEEEVSGLLNQLDAAITQKADGAKYAVSRGDIVFKRGETTVTPTITDELYLAVYNHYLISEDNWMGAHNPRFTIDLLQESYRVLSGSALPNAEKYGEEEGGGSEGGSEESTGGG